MQRKALDIHSPWKLAQAAVIDGDVSRLERLLREHPELRDEDPPPYVPRGPRPDYSQGDARSIILREHCFDGLSEFVRYQEALREKDGDVSQFEAAVDATVKGDLATLRALLHGNRELVHRRSTRRHHSTLLHYVGANGVEAFRQKTPKNALKVLDTLVEAGADVNAIADLYGKSTTLELIATSVHPWLAGVQLDLLDALIRAGAAVGGGPELGNVVTAALHNGRGEAAVFLATRGAQLGLEGEAGIGNLVAVKGHLNQDGSLRNPVIPAQLSLAFLWACQYGRTSVVEFLLESVDADTTNAGLHWAAMSGNVATLDLFLKRNLPLETRNQWGGTVLSGTIWCAEYNDQVDYAPVVEALIAAGAQVDAEPGLKARVERILTA